MEYFKKFSDITENQTNGKENYNIIKKAFDYLKENQIIMLNACDTYYICHIQYLEKFYQLYSFYIEDGIIRKNENPIIRIDRINKDIKDDIILANDKEKFYSFTLITNDHKSPKTYKEPEDVKVLTSVDDYMNNTKKVINVNNNNQVKKINKYEQKEIEVTPVPMGPLQHPKRKIIKM